MTAENVCRKVPGAVRKVPGTSHQNLAKLLILLIAMSRKVLLVAKCRKVPQSTVFTGLQSLAKSFSQSPPLRGRPSVPPPVGLGRSHRCFGGTGRADFEGTTPQCVQASGIPYRPMSAGWL